MYIYSVCVNNIAYLPVDYKIATEKTI